MKILLLSPPYLKEYMRNARCDFVSLSATQWYPILLGYCGSYLELKGHEVKLIDAPAEGLSHDSVYSIIKAYRPEMIVLYTGFMSEENDLKFADNIVEELKCEAVIVGPYASIDPEQTLKRSRVINKVVVGEFEYPVNELASGAKPAEVNNLLFKEGDKVISNPTRPYLTGGELDAIPFVSRFFRDHVNIRKYKTPSELYPFIDIMTGRGCKWGACTYCLWAQTFVKGSTYNMRSMNNVIDELRFIEKDMPRIRSIMLQDDTFTEERALYFSKAKISAGIKLPWSCYARADIDYDALKLMKKSGCRNLHVGYESASPDVLKTIRKGLTVERMTEFTRNAKKAGLRIHGDFAFGLPGETLKDADATIKWAYELNPDTAQFQIMIPFPKTHFYNHMKKNNWLNAEGHPNMPGFTNKQIRLMAKKAYRKFYLSPKYLCKCLLHPYDHLLSQINTIKRAIPAMFWKEWQV